MSNERKPGTEFPISQPVNGKMIVEVSDPEIEYGGSFAWINSNDRGFDLTEDTLRLANIKIRVQLSQDSNYHVEIKKYSRGKNGADAESRAQKIGFSAKYSDSVLDVGSGIAIGRENKFRAQQVVVVIEVPEGKKIRFDETINKLHALSIRSEQSKKWHRYNGDFDLNWDEYFDYETDVDYTMGKDGYLINPNKPQKENNGNYRYDSNDSTKDLQKSIKERERKLEQERKQLEEDKKRLKDTIPGSNKKETVDDVTDKSNTGSITYSPLFSFASLLN
jgi:hypothetical protein